MWYDGRYVEPDDEGNVYGKGQLSQRKRLLLVGLKHARVARLLAVADNAPLPPPHGVPGPDDGDLVGGRDPDEEELIPIEDRATVSEKLAHLVLRKALESCPISRSSIGITWPWYSNVVPSVAGRACGMYGRS